MKISRFTLFIPVMASVFLFSCKKEGRRDRLDLTSSNDVGIAEAVFNDLKQIADEAYRGNLVLYRGAQDTLVSGCATVIRDTSITPRTITVDFGPNNCQCNDGKTRRGVIQISYTGAYRDSGTVVTITPQMYFVNDHQVTGTKTVTNVGRNANNNLVYYIEVSGTIIKANGGGTVTWSSTRWREWIAGESTTLNWLDDVYLIAGTGNGTSSSGEPFSAAIITPLRKEMSCYHFVSGVIELRPGNRPIRTIDFGSGTCDNTATVTVDGNTFTITLY